MVGWYTRKYLEEDIVKLLDANPTRLYSGIDVARELGKESRYQTVLAVLKGMTLPYKFLDRKNRITRGHDDSRCGNRHTFHSNNRAAALKEEARRRREEKQDLAHNRIQLLQYRDVCDKYAPMLHARGWELHTTWTEYGDRWVLAVRSQAGDEYRYRIGYDIADILQKVIMEDIPVRSTTTSATA